VAACALFTCLMPLPFRTAAWGVVWLPEHAQARPDTDGFITQLVAHDGQRVMPGQLLLRLDDPALFAQRDKLSSQLAGLQSDRFDSLARDSLKAGNLEEEMRRVAGELRRAEERIAQLEVRSQVAGTFVMPAQQDRLGTWVKRGSTLGYILDRKEIGVRVAVPERDAALIRQGTSRVEVRLAESVPDATFAGLVREVPAAVHELPSAAQEHVLQPFDRRHQRQLAAHAPQLHRGLRREAQRVRGVGEDDDGRGGDGFVFDAVRMPFAVK
jgi:putative peptide zinc metalloprotease protein